MKNTGFLALTKAQRAALLFNNKKSTDRLTDLDAVNFLRAAINWMDERDEYLNEKSTPELLLSEFTDHVFEQNSIEDKPSKSFHSFLTKMNETTANSLGIDKMELHYLNKFGVRIFHTLPESLQVLICATYANIYRP
jgi:hypothetical protein